MARQEVSDIASPAQPYHRGGDGEVGLRLLCSSQFAGGRTIKRQLERPPSPDMLPQTCTSIRICHKVYTIPGVRSEKVNALTERILRKLATRMMDIIEPYK